jgi:hypothetical protein
VSPHGSRPSPGGRGAPGRIRREGGGAYRDGNHAGLSYGPAVTRLLVGLCTAYRSAAVFTVRPRSGALVTDHALWCCRDGGIRTSVCLHAHPRLRAKLQAVSRWVRAQVKSCGICGGQSGTGAGFLPVLRFVRPLIHSTNCSTIITIYHPDLVQ